MQNDQKIIKKLFKRKFPKLFVCYGFQLLANLFNSNITKIGGHTRTIHDLNINYDKKINLKVNSYHDFAITDLNPIFRIARLKKDNSIEFADIKKYKVMCCMFHPERKNKSQIIINKLIKEFFTIK